MMATKHNGSRYDAVWCGTPDTYIEDGIRLGTVLGRKLQIRSETRETKYTRKLKGRIDKRLIAELGFDNQNVFSQTFMDSYPDAFLHISVDASGSMSSVVAMAKAIDMISNVDLVISFRSTQQASGGGYRSRRNDTFPIILMAYDSRKDSFNKIKTLFKYINVAGTTPEGLCYEAILNDMIPASKDRESYFLNFSDGMPMFDNGDINYHNRTASKHTKKMVDEIKLKGIKVISYYIEESSYSNRYAETFKEMYGNDSQFINVTSVMAVAKSMNKKFLEKN